MSRADITLDITFDINEPEKSIIKTNAKREVVLEILEDWLYCQMGQGKDNSKPIKKDFYSIKIFLDLSDDSFSTVSDTGNEGLTCGIIMHLSRIFSCLEIQPLFS
jgi:hypothetical protein